MLEETYYLGAYWGARREEVGECSRRAELFFHMLARCDVSLGQWYRSGRVPRGTPGHLVRTNDRGALEELFLRGRNRTDLHERVIEALGFSLDVWNQLPDAKAAKLSINCGVFSEEISNTCIVELPSQGEAVERMLSLPTLIQVLTSMVIAWDPDWGVVNTNRALMELVPRGDERTSDVGWVTYLAHRRGTVPPLPAPVRIEPVGELGMLVILTPERFTASNPEHIALGRRVHELLDRAGLLKPLPS
ncbi:immunity 52 family protein [Hyalangium rubrum]|uniref:Immunity 52 family protein n=1 Tax=Hyalangium rubrum TaxID=3103134 RepID=A0ABU5GZJ3_9BACT|nr:immunity 52 family protein [Hyalangium sp. s54d21]MDY7225957.1 immunity 52 family protein [Hyalangium sp. s54d21]